MDVLPFDNFCWIGTDIYWSFRYMSIMPSQVFHSTQLSNLPNYQGNLELSGQTQSSWYLGPWTVLGGFRSMEFTVNLNVGQQELHIPLEN